jgi:hypothetical protein
MTDLTSRNSLTESFSTSRPFWEEPKVAPIGDLVNRPRAG